MSSQVEDPRAGPSSRTMSAGLSSRTPRKPPTPRGGDAVRPHTFHCRRFLQGSIPGYAGFVPGRNAEDVHGSTFMEANDMAFEACGRRGRPPTSVGVSLATGADDNDTNHPGRVLDTASLFHNPRGHQPRAGSAIPGYAGIIPGKYPGSVFGKRFAMDNVQATEVRHFNHRGEDMTTKWVCHAANDKRQMAHGAGAVGEHWQVTKPWRSGRQGVSRLVQEANGWRLHEPRATQEFIRY